MMVSVYHMNRYPVLVPPSVLPSCELSVYIVRSGRVEVKDGRIVTAGGQICQPAGLRILEILFF